MTKFVRQLLKKSSGLDESHIPYPEKVSSRGTLSFEGLLEGSLQLKSPTPIPLTF